MSPKAALYIRVSSDEQVFGFSIDAQLDALQEHCRQHNISISKCYVEEGKSAKSIKGRPALQQLLADAKQNQFQVVLVWKISRLARNLNDLLQILEHFNKHNVGFQSLTEDIQTDSTMGQLMVQVIGATAELERNQISDNAKLGIDERNRKGQWNSGNLVLGYQWHKLPEQGQSQLEVVRSEAQLVKHIFQMYADGLGLKAITNRLNATGYKTKKGLSFGIAAVRGILTNPNYIGKIRIGTSKKRLKTDGVVQCVDGEHEPIIPQDLWDKVQSRYGTRSSPPTKTIKRHSPLTGLLKCPECGYSMTAAHTKNYNKNGTIRQNYYYICSRYANYGASACHTNAIRANDVEQWFFRQIQDLVMSPELLRQIVVAVNLKRDIERMPLEHERIRLEKELAAFEKRQQRCFELFEDGHIDHMDFVGRLTELKEQQTMQQSALIGVEQQLSNPRIEFLHTDSIRNALKQFHKMFRMAAAQKQKQLLQSLFDKITLPHDRDISKAVIHGSNQLQQLQLTGQMEEKQLKTKWKG